MVFRVLSINPKISWRGGVEFLVIIRHSANKYYVISADLMRLRVFVCCLMVCVLGGCSGAGRFDTQYAAGYSVPKPISCVPYTRDVSNFNIRGDAYTWWDQAAQSYGRGNTPKRGAVLVLAKTSKLTRGHVAMVTRAVDKRHIDVTHSNWGSDRASRSVIYERMRVEDVSVANDWSLVRFWNHEAGAFGQPYPAYGFIYK